MQLEAHCTGVSRIGSPVFHVFHVFRLGYARRPTTVVRASMDTRNRKRTSADLSDDLRAHPVGEGPPTTTQPTTKKRRSREQAALGTTAHQDLYAHVTLSHGGRGTCSRARP